MATPLKFLMGRVRFERTTNGLKDWSPHSAWYRLAPKLLSFQRLHSAGFHADSSFIALCLPAGGQFGGQLARLGMFLQALVAAGHSTTPL